MPFKIYTYQDPYRLDQTDFWEEIQALPHFCVSRTLVNGLRDVIGASVQGLLCPLDNLVSHEDVYQHWTDNIGRRIQQYSALTAIFNEHAGFGAGEDLFRLALGQNQTEVLNAVRLLIELGIDASALDTRRANKEQRLLVLVLEELQRGNELFRFPDTPNRSKLRETIIKLAELELKEYLKKPTASPQHLPWYDRAIETTQSHPLEAVVVHGVHQFSPAQLRLLFDMDRMGLTVIFLFNYQQDYAAIYSTWKYVYQGFDAPVHHDASLTGFRPDILQTPGNALAAALGELWEERPRDGTSRLGKLHELYEHVELREFANVTEYARFVSRHVDAAKKEYDDSRSVVEQGNRVWSNAAVLRRVSEQVYTANQDIHTLLKIYYPEFAPNRHFLAYPIGQFFSAIYRLWDYERGAINMEPGALKECLSSRMLSAGPAEELLRTYYNLEMLMENLGSFQEFESRIKGKYVAAYRKITKAHASDPVASLSQLAIYNRYKVGEKDIEALIRAVEELNKIAIQLFVNERSHEDYVNFGRHFENLEAFIKQHQLELANEEERNLINELMQRLDKIKPERLEFSGTFRDLREGLHFYLNNKSPEYDVDWIVKNFEQIDGDILQSKKQLERGEGKVYHFACVSDRDLSCPIDELLPWPLTDSFLGGLDYSRIHRSFQIYHASLTERGNFLRYALFYGLYFNHCGARLSYVKQYGNELTEPYVLLPLLGLSPRNGPVEELEEEPRFLLSTISAKRARVNYSRLEMMDAFLCPHRYLLDYVMSDAPALQGSFLCQKFYENLLVSEMWKRVGKMSKTMAQERLPAIARELNAAYSQYVDFLRPTERLDLELRAQNYLLHQVILESKGSAVEEYSWQNETHMEIRGLFGAALFKMDISDREPKNPYQSLEDLAQQKFPDKIYSLHTLPYPKKPADQAKRASLCRDVESYLNDPPPGKTAIVSDWCTYCTHRGVCTEPFAAAE